MPGVPPLPIRESRGFSPILAPAILLACTFACAAPEAESESEGSSVPANRPSLASATASATRGDRARARELGIVVGRLEPGPSNAITDVAGVAVGHHTLIVGDGVRTGVTAVVPIAGVNPFTNKVPAAVVTGNGFGKAAGFTQVEELGNLEAPIVLTNTLSVGTAVEAAARWVLDQPGNERVRSVNVVVGETNDGYLNEIRAPSVLPEHVVRAIESATTGPIAEGSVGAGTGTVCFGWKGGIGTASRRFADSGWTVGVLVQSNFGGELRIDGSPFRATSSGPDPRGDDDDGSCMIVVATDAPLGDRNLRRLARRALFGLARTGSVMSNGSGDYVIAFSTYPGNVLRPGESLRSTSELPNAAMTPFFWAAVEATEEAVLNSMTTSGTMRGRDGHEIEGIDLDRLRGIAGSARAPR